MNGKSGLMLLLAVLCGLGAMYGARQMLAKDEAPKEMVHVVVAARDLKMEEVLKEDMLKVIEMPKSNAPVGSFSSPDELIDRWVQIKMLAGEPIIAPKLAPKNAPPGMIGRIPQGMRALAIEVNEQTGVSGFILPDHHVDVLQSKTESRGRTAGLPQAECILQDVLVLAAGQVMTRPEDRSIQVRTVTLAVTPEQAEKLVAARSKGPLSLALRGLGDHEVVAHKAPPEPEPEPEPKPEPKPEPPKLVEAPAPPPPPVMVPVTTKRVVPVTKHTKIVRGFFMPHQKVPYHAGFTEVEEVVQMPREQAIAQGYPVPEASPNPGSAAAPKTQTGSPPPAPTPVPATPPAESPIAITLPGLAGVLSNPANWSPAQND